MAPHSLQMHKNAQFTRVPAMEFNTNTLRTPTKNHMLESNFSCRDNPSPISMQLQLNFLCYDSTFKIFHGLSSERQKQTNITGQQNTGRILLCFWYQRLVSCISATTMQTPQCQISRGWRPSPPMPPIPTSATTALSGTFSKSQTT